MNELVNLNPEWISFLENELNNETVKKLFKYMNDSYSSKVIYPPKKLVFDAFNQCSLKKLKVVIIGQDPYHGAGQANGLSFSVSKGVTIPPSLKNIFKEISHDLPNFNTPLHGDLSSWAQQGVLLLNAILTVEANKPGSHKKIGWEDFTNSVITKLSNEKTNLVFLLWGNFAQSKAVLIDAHKHLVLTAAHPSPLARGAFFGNKHFSQTNAYLKLHHLAPIDWNLEGNLFSE